MLHNTQIIGSLDPLRIIGSLDPLRIIIFIYTNSLFKLFFTRSLRAIISASCDPIGIIKGQQQGASMLFLVRWHPVDVLTVSHDLRAVKLDDLIGRNLLGVYFFT